jgi:hypothetical protein
LKSLPHFFSLGVVFAGTFGRHLAQIIHRTSEKHHTL